MSSGWTYVLPAPLPPPPQISGFAIPMESSSFSTNSPFFCKRKWRFAPGRHRGPRTNADFLGGGSFLRIDLNHVVEAGSSIPECPRTSWGDNVCGRNDWMKFLNFKLHPSIVHGWGIRWMVATALLKRSLRGLGRGVGICSMWGRIVGATFDDLDDSAEISGFLELDSPGADFGVIFYPTEAFLGCILCVSPTRFFWCMARPETPSK